MPDKLDAIVLAGGALTPDDPLFPFSQGQPKSLIRVGGRFMVEWVVAALQAARGVADIVIAGISAEQAATVGLTFDRPVTYLPDRGHVVRNNYAAVSYLRARKPEQECYLLCSADIPLLTAAMVEAFMADCAPFDHILYYAVITESTMAARFPQSQRSFVRFREAMVAGGDLYIFKAALMQQQESFWDLFVAARKNALQLAWLLGPGFLLKLLLRRLSLADLEQKGAAIFGAPVKVVLVPDAEIGMDVDRPEHLQLVESELD